MPILPSLSTAPSALARHDRDMVYQGHADYVCEATDWQTVGEAIAWCHAEKMPVTFCGSHTSMTGASAPDGGVALSLGKFARILDISRHPDGTGTVVAEPGVILGDLKRAVASAGLFYPPDPTSFNEAQLGATVATNATGEDTFRYGPTRLYVRELEILDASGNHRTLKRLRPAPMLPFKNTAGYCLDGEEMDQVIGSEGTLALITRLTLDLLPDPGTPFLMVLPFDDFWNCLRAVVKLATGALKPRALELLGPGTGAYFRSCPACPVELMSGEIFLYLKDDYRDPTEFDRKTTAWFETLEKIYGELGESQSLERVHLASAPRQLEALRQCRHHIPLKVNEDYFPFVAEGGGKIGTDWWVPLHHLEDMMLEVQKEAETLNIPYLVFGHIGNGHPHWDFLTRTPEEKSKAWEFVKRQCRKAALFGGGVAGEHGIGKIKRELVALQHAPKVIGKMVELKTRWDPNWILGRGNILVRAN